MMCLKTTCDAPAVLCVVMCDLIGLTIASVVYCQTTESEAPQMSVLERARHMNRIQSQSELASSEAADRRRRHTAKQVGMRIK